MGHGIVMLAHKRKNDKYKHIYDDLILIKKYF